VVEHPQQPVGDGGMPEVSRVHSEEQAASTAPIASTLPDAPATPVLREAPRRPKFRDRARAQEASVSPVVAQVSPAARGLAIQGQDQGRRISGLVALVAGVALLTYAITRLTTPTSSAPAAAPTPVVVPTPALPPFAPLAGAALTARQVLANSAGLRAPREVVSFPDGHIAVADPDNRRVVLLATDGTVLKSITAAGSGALQAPYALVATAHTLFVLDAQRATIERYSASGRFEGELSHDQLLYDGRGMALDGNGHFYIANPLLNGFVVVSVSDGKILSKTVTPLGVGPGQFNQPSAVAVDVRGDLYVMDNLNGRIQELGPSGQFIAQWPAPNTDTLHSAHLLVLPGAQARLVVSDPPEHALLVYALSGGQTTRFPLQVAGQPTGAVGPLGLFAHKNGAILVADGSGNRVLTVDVPASALQGIRG